MQWSSGDAKVRYDWERDDEDDEPEAEPGAGVREPRRPLQPLLVGGATAETDDD